MRKTSKLLLGVRFAASRQLALVRASIRGPKTPSWHSNRWSATLAAFLSFPLKAPGAK